MVKILKKANYRKAITTRVVKKNRGDKKALLGVTYEIPTLINILA